MISPYSDRTFPRFLSTVAVKRRKRKGGDLSPLKNHCYCYKKYVFLQLLL